MKRTRRCIYHIIFNLLMANTAQASTAWHKPYCEANCATEEIQSSGVKDLMALSSLHREASSLNSEIHEKVKSWSVYVSELEKGKEPEDWNKKEQTGREILEVTQAIGVLEKKVEICRTNCSAGRRVELELELENLIKIRSILLNDSSWWLSDKFLDLSDRLKKNPDYRPGKEEMKKTFLSSMETFFKDSNTLLKQTAEISRYIEQALSWKSLMSPSKTLNFLSVRYSTTMDILLQRGLTKDPQLCAIAENKSKWDEAKSYASLGTQIGLTTVGILSGPGGLLSLGARSAVPWLSRLGIMASRVNSFIPSTIVGMKLLDDRLRIERECNNLLVGVKLDIGGSADWQKCLESKSEADLKIALSALTVVSTPFLPSLISRMGIKFDPPAPPASLIHPMKDGKVLSYLDLSQKSEISTMGLGDISSKYWAHVARVYKNRLNLSDDEISSFMKSSQAFEDRTRLVVQTSGPVHKANFDGGAAIVVSKKATDPLPFEKATGITVPRDVMVGELVRLTGEGAEQGVIIKNVMTQISTMTKTQPDLKKLYIFTSKAHMRLYRQHKVPHTRLEDPNERDVLLVIDVDDFRKAFPEPTYH